MQALGFKSAMTQEEPIPADKPRLLAIGAFALWVAAAAIGGEPLLLHERGHLFGRQLLPAKLVRREQQDLQL